MLGGCCDCSLAANRCSQAAVRCSLAAVRCSLAAVRWLSGRFEMLSGNCEMLSECCKIIIYSKFLVFMNKNLLKLGSSGHSERLWLPKVLWPLGTRLPGSRVFCSAEQHMANFQFHFIGSWSFPLYFWMQCCIKHVKLIKSTWNLLLWMLGNSFTFRQQKQVNSLKNTGGAILLSWTQWREFFFLIVWFKITTM